MLPDYFVYFDNLITVHFRYVVFRPFVDEILVGKIKSCSKEGVNGRLIYGFCKLSRLMGKPTICICENKDADQLHGNRSRS